jgi:hypothetical protein
MSRRAAFYYVTGLCPKHGKIEIPFFPPPLSRNSRDELVINLSDSKFLEDFAQRTVSSVACPACGSALSYEMFAENPEERRQQILDQLVYWLLKRYPKLKGLSPDVRPAEIEKVVKVEHKRIWVTIDSSASIKLTDYLRALGAEADVSFSPSGAGAETTRSEITTYTEYDVLDKELKAAFVSKLLMSQSGKCAVCGNYIETRRKAGYMGPVLDHDHHSDKIRGVLHPDCNVDLGAIERRSPEWQASAVEYLRRHGPGLGPT